MSGKPAAKAAKRRRPRAKAARKPKPTRYVLELYVSGAGLRSLYAIENAKRIFETRFPARFELTIVDLHEHPERAQAEDLIVSPTLIKRLPAPLRRVFGDLSDEDRVLIGLGMRPEDEP